MSVDSEHCDMAKSTLSLHIRRMIGPLRSSCATCGAKPLEACAPDCAAVLAAESARQRLVLPDEHGGDVGPASDPSVIPEG
jgi:hypothetical protein